MAGGFVLRLLVRTAGFCAVLALFAWGFGGGGGVWAEVRNAKGVAVIIGNGEYEHRDVPDVRYAHRDAEAFRRYVVDVLGFNPENVIDLRDATRRKMFDALGTRSDPRSDLWSYLDPDGGSEVVIFYSGHGVPGERDKRGYLLPVDADPKAAEEDGYPIDLLYENVGKLREATTVQVFLDACFSGSSHEGGLIRDASPVYVAATLPAGLGEKLTSLTAATGKQIASWDDETEHGLFTHHLLEALYGKADRDKDGKVTAKEAKRYLDRRMTRAARRKHRRVQQASLVGAEGVVLASVVEGGSFPERPVLGEEKAGGENKSEVVRPSTPDAAGVEAGLGLKREGRVLVQRGLKSMGLGVGYADGLFGEKTRGAIREWQEGKGFKVTGYLTGEQAEALRAVGEEERREQADRERKQREREERERLARAAAEAEAQARAEAERQRKAQEEAAKRRVEEMRPGREFRDCEECPEMVVMLGGSYMMGSRSGEGYSDERPRHRVEIPGGLAVGKYEVTFWEWDACVAGGGCGGYRPDDKGWGRGRRPVMNVSWEDAKDYVEWLSGKTGKGYRMLSESEWEYAARAGTTTAYSWGDQIGVNRANCAGCGSRWDDKSTAPVGSFEANGYGLHDMHGNVSEWVEDCWHGNYEGATRDGRAWTTGNDCSGRVLRGGSWNYGPGYLRSAFRLRFTAGNRDDLVGFRVARTLTP